MTDNEINVAIGKVMGVKIDRSIFACGIPNYCNDLNAMNEAEKDYISKSGDYFYMVELTDVVRREHKDGGIEGYIVCATARQRAEAFLRTLGKWKD